MTNQAEIDYEKQFQDDLAKATALSLEQQVLDEYQRSKKYGRQLSIDKVNSFRSSEDSSTYYAQIQRRNLERSNSISSQNTPLPAVPSRNVSGQSANQNQRRHSEVPGNLQNVEAERPRTPPPTAPVSSSRQAENDLISFNSPTAKNPDPFDKLIEDLHKLQVPNAQTALVPLGPTAAGLRHMPVQNYGYAPLVAGSAAYAAPPPAAHPQYYATGAGSVGALQLVPYTPPPSQEKKPLTNEELQKLYSLSTST